MVWTGSSTAYPQVGLRGAGNNFATNVNNRSVSASGSWLSSTPGTSNSSTCYVDFSVESANGLTYLWTPGAFYNASFSWLPTTGLSNPNIANPIASPGNTTNYSVTVSYGNSCTSIDSILVTVVVCTGIEDLSEAQTLLFYPNPTNGIFYVENVIDKSIELTATSGEIIYSSKMIRNKAQIDLTNFAQGVYFLKVQDNNGVKIQKLIKN